MYWKIMKNGEIGENYDLKIKFFISVTALFVNKMLQKLKNGGKLWFFQSGENIENVDAKMKNFRYLLFTLSIGLENRFPL